MLLAFLMCGMGDDGASGPASTQYLRVKVMQPLLFLIAVDVVYRYREELAALLCSTDRCDVALAIQWLWGEQHFIVTLIICRAFVLVTHSLGVGKKGRAAISFLWWLAQSCGLLSGLNGNVSIGIPKQGRRWGKLKYGTTFGPPVPYWVRELPLATYCAAPVLLDGQSALPRPWLLAWPSPALPRTQRAALLTFHLWAAFAVVFTLRERTTLRTDFGSTDDCKLTQDGYIEKSRTEGHKGCCNWFASDLAITGGGTGGSVVVAHYFLPEMYTGVVAMLLLLTWFASRSVSPLRRRQVCVGVAMLCFLLLRKFSSTPSPDAAWVNPWEEPSKAVWQALTNASTLTTWILFQLALPLVLPRCTTIVSNFGMNGIWPFLGHPLTLAVALDLGQPLMRNAATWSTGLWYPTTTANLVLTCVALFWLVGVPFALQALFGALAFTRSLTYTVGLLLCAPVNQGALHTLQSKARVVSGKIHTLRRWLRSLSHEADVVFNRLLLGMLSMVIRPSAAEASKGTAGLEPRRHFARHSIACVAVLALLMLGGASMPVIALSVGTAAGGPLMTALGLGSPLSRDLHTLRMLVRADGLMPPPEGLIERSISSARLRVLASDCGWLVHNDTRPGAASRFQGAGLKSQRKGKKGLSGLGHSKDAEVRRGSADGMRSAKGRTKQVKQLTRNLTKLEAPIQQRPAPLTRGRHLPSCAIVKRTSRRRTCRAADWGCDAVALVLWTRRGCAGKFICEGLTLLCASTSGGGPPTNCSCAAGAESAKA